MRCTLKQLVADAMNQSYAVPCFNVFGYEDAVAVVNAAVSLKAPVVLAVNKEMLEFMGPVQSASMLGLLADDADTEVCVHLDHCYDEELAKMAIAAGYNSVMFDGSQLPLDENIQRTRALVEFASGHGVSVEGEVGSVSYSKGRDHIRHKLTEPEEAKMFADETNVDAVAISIGNVHRLESTSSTVDHDRLQRIAALVKQPLVIHGTSGIPDVDLQKMSKTSVCKFNIGTRLRMAFGDSLRRTLNNKPEEFDRLTIFSDVIPVVQQEAARNIVLLGAAKTELSA